MPAPLNDGQAGALLNQNAAMVADGTLSPTEAAPLIEQIETLMALRSETL